MLPHSAEARCRLGPVTAARIAAVTGEIMKIILWIIAIIFIIGLLVVTGVLKLIF